MDGGNFRSRQSFSAVGDSTPRRSSNFSWILAVIFCTGAGAAIGFGIFLWLATKIIFIASGSGVYYYGALTVLAGGGAFFGFLAGIRFCIDQIQYERMNNRR